MSETTDLQTMAVSAVPVLTTPVCHTLILSFPQLFNNDKYLSVILLSILERYFGNVKELHRYTHTCISQYYMYYTYYTYCTYEYNTYHSNEIQMKRFSLSLSLSLSLSFSSF